MEQFISEILNIKDGETIIEEDSLAYHAYILLSGKANVFKSFNGKQVYLGELKEGEIFGEMSFFGLAKRGATVIAEGKVKVGLITKETFMALLEELPKNARSKLERMSYNIFYLNDIYCRLVTCLHELLDANGKLLDPDSPEDEDMSFFMKKISSLMCNRFQNTSDKCSMAISLYGTFAKPSDKMPTTLI